MIYTTLFLSCLEIDLIIEFLEDTDHTMSDALDHIGVDMDTGRLAEQLLNDRCFEQCMLCGNWAVTGGDSLCLPCWLETEEESDFAKEVLGGVGDMPDFGVIECQ